MDNRGSQFVLWNDNQYSYMVLTNDMTLDEAVRIAASIRLYPPTRPIRPTCRSTRDCFPTPTRPRRLLRTGTW